MFDSMGPSEEPYEMCLIIACCLENERVEHLSTGSCSLTLLGCAYMCAGQFPVPVSCLRGARGPGGTRVMLVRARAPWGAAAVAPVKEKAKRIYKVVEVAGTEGIF